MFNILHDIPRSILSILMVSVAKGTALQLLATLPGRTIYYIIEQPKGSWAFKLPVMLHLQQLASMCLDDCSMNCAWLVLHVFLVQKNCLLVMFNFINVCATMFWEWVHWVAMCWHQTKDHHPDIPGILGNRLGKANTSSQQREDAGICLSRDFFVVLWNLLDTFQLFSCMFKDVQWFRSCFKMFDYFCVICVCFCMLLLYFLYFQAIAFQEHWPFEA